MVFPTTPTNDSAFGKDELEVVGGFIREGVYAKMSYEELYVIGLTIRTVFPLRRSSLDRKHQDQ